MSAGNCNIYQVLWVVVYAVLINTTAVHSIKDECIYVQVDSSRLWHVIPAYHGEFWSWFLSFVIILPRTTVRCFCLLHFDPNSHRRRRPTLFAKLFFLVFNLLPVRLCSQKEPRRQPGSFMRIWIYIYFNSARCCTVETGFLKKH